MKTMACWLCEKSILKNVSLKAHLNRYYLTVTSKLAHCLKSSRGFRGNSTSFFYKVQVVKRTFILEIFRPPLEGFALSNNIKVGMN